MLHDDLDWDQPTQDNVEVLVSVVLVVQVCQLIISRNQQAE